MIEPLDQDTIDIQLKSLNNDSPEPWDIVDGKLHREFKFTDFISAFGFMTQVAILAERADHHPEWSNVYSAWQKTPNFQKIRTSTVTDNADGLLSCGIFCLHRPRDDNDYHKSLQPGIAPP